MAKKKEDENGTPQVKVERTVKKTYNRPQSPLDNGHLETLRKLSKSCAETREFLAKCKECMLDVDKECDLNEDQARVCEQIQRTFFPQEV